MEKLMEKFQQRTMAEVWQYHSTQHLWILSKDLQMRQGGQCSGMSQTATPHHGWLLGMRKIMRVWRKKKKSKNIGKRFTVMAANWVWKLSINSARSEFLNRMMM